MSIEKLTKRLQGKIDFALDNAKDLDATSRDYREDIVLSVNEAQLLLELVQTHRKKINSQRDKKALQELHIVSVSSRSLVFRNPTSKSHSGWLELDKYSDGEVSIELRDLDSYLLTKEQLDFVQEWILYPYY